MIIWCLPQRNSFQKLLTRCQYYVIPACQVYLIDKKESRLRHDTKKSPLKMHGSRLFRRLNVKTKLILPYLTSVLSYTNHRTTIFTCHPKHGEHSLANGTDQPIRKSKKLEEFLRPAQGFEPLHTDTSALSLSTRLRGRTLTQCNLTDRSICHRLHTQNKI